MNVGNGLVHIGFVKPEVDLVISCNVGELKMFIDTVDVVRKHTEPLGPKSRSTRLNRKVSYTLAAFLY